MAEGERKGFFLIRAFGSPRHYRPLNVAGLTGLRKGLKQCQIKDGVQRGLCHVEVCQEFSGIYGKGADNEPRHRYRQILAQSGYSQYT